MRNFFILFLQIGFVAFTMTAVFATINYFTGWHLNFKGAEIPGDLGIAAIALVLGAACGIGARVMIKKDEAPALDADNRK